MRITLTYRNGVKTTGSTLDAMLLVADNPDVRTVVIEGANIRHTQLDCDETCRGCERCYRADGDTNCDKLCRHATDNYPYGWPED